MKPPLPQASQAIKTRPALGRGSKKPQSYKPLKTQFSKNGHDYRQIAREGDIVIFEQSWRGSPNVCYEVAWVYRHDGYTVAGHYVEPAEVYPGNEEFGDSAWTLTTLDAAWDKLRELVKEAKQK
jgi:hypothetical protein